MTTSPGLLLQHAIQSTVHLKRNKLTASVNASLFCSSWASNSFCTEKQNYQCKCCKIWQPHYCTQYVLLNLTCILTDSLILFIFTIANQIKQMHLLSTACILLSQRMLETSLHTFQWQAERKQTDLSHQMSCYMSGETTVWEITMNLVTENISALTPLDKTHCNINRFYTLSAHLGIVTIHD